MTQRQEELAQELTDQLRGLEDKSIGRIGRIWQQALRRTVDQVKQKLDRFAEQPEYDPETTPGAFLGSTPDGPVPITPDQKNLAAITLEGPLLQDLRFTLSQLPLSPRQVATIDGELTSLFDQAQDLGTEYALELTREGLQPALDFVVSPPNRPPSPWPDREYREGQRFTRLFDMAGSIAAAQRDFRSLSENYRRQRNATTDAHVKASKNYYYKWWRRWGESVSFETATQMAAGPDPRALKRKLEERLPTINDAFRNRAETIARTETLMASGEAQERTYRALRVGFVQWAATEDERVCEWCAPRAGCLYWLGSVRAPIHPRCRCNPVPITLESLVIQNAMASKKAENWEQEAQKLAADTAQQYQGANGVRPMRPVGGPGESRGERDYPLMERTLLPQTKRREALPGTDTLNAAAAAWPRGTPVWCPRRGWLDPAARQAYEAIQAEVAAM